MTTTIATNPGSSSTARSTHELTKGISPVEWNLAGGSALIDAETGAPRQFRYAGAPERLYLLDETVDAWHSREHRWGSGFLTTDTGSWRWNRPDVLELDESSSRALYRLGPGLRLEVHRHADFSFEETYVLHNDSDTGISIGSWAIAVPFREVYEDAETSLLRGINAHVWTGGTNSWVAATPMSGGDGVLTLQLQEGHLGAYSVESRNSYSSSDVRGEILLHATDFARSPDAFGGQSPISLGPGGEVRVRWRLQFDEDSRAFADRVRPSTIASRLTAEVGQTIDLKVDPGARVAILDPEIAVLETLSDNRRSVRGIRHGIVHVDIDGQRIALLFHLPLPQVVRQRVDYILRWQRPRERRDRRAGALVPVDTRTRLTQTTNGWPDWSDGAERIGMAVFLQEALKRGWCDPAPVSEALDAWGVFARDELLDSTGAPRWGSISIVSTVRLYNAPWLAHFFAEEHRRKLADGLSPDLDLASRILERSYELGAREHLSIGHPEAVILVAELLDLAGEPSRATALRRELIATAEHFARVGRKLPRHEVNYEQSMVAPLLTLFSVAHSIRGHGFEDQISEVLEWLRAFAGSQPHARMNAIPIRHWDGHWFGLRRQWGDVFPHHWSALSAVAFSQLPSSFRTSETEEDARRIFAANLASFHDDGSATCAFVLPSAVDGMSAYDEDPLANDQDWALALWMRSAVTPTWS